MSRLQEQYKNELAGEIQKKLGLKNSEEVPKITKITVNMGVGGAVADKKILEKARDDLEKIAGQKLLEQVLSANEAQIEKKHEYKLLEEAEEQRRLAYLIEKEERESALRAEADRIKAEKEEEKAGHAH